jgi:hypothetical protein
MGTVTPQMKNIAVNDRFGNSGIKKQQGSTVIKYDTLPLARRVCRIEPAQLDEQIGDIASLSVAANKL